MKFEEEVLWAEEVWQDLLAHVLAMREKRSIQVIAGKAITEWYTISELHRLMQAMLIMMSGAGIAPMLSPDEDEGASSKGAKPDTVDVYQTEEPDERTPDEHPDPISPGPH